MAYRDARGLRPIIGSGVVGLMSDLVHLTYSRQWCGLCALSHLRHAHQCRRYKVRVALLGGFPHPTQMSDLTRKVAYVPKCPICPRRARYVPSVHPRGRARRGGWSGEYYSVKGPQSKNFF